MKIIPNVKQNTRFVKKTSAEIITFFCRGKEKLHYHSAIQKRHNKSLILYKSTRTRARIYEKNTLRQKVKLLFPQGLVKTPLWHTK